METWINFMWLMGFIRRSVVHIKYTEFNLHIGWSIHGHHKTINIYRISIEISCPRDDSISMDRVRCYNMSTDIRLARQKQASNGKDCLLNEKSSFDVCQCFVSDSSGRRRIPVRFKYCSRLRCLLRIGFILYSCCCDVICLHTNIYSCLWSRKFN